ncbi:MAG: hypothetical protein JRH10_07355 [Deltaproteobacteria bacterium]|nr:hypothetical protein [Deltaproteobacteria bacterium]MBW2447035.1 hypothetical protein [Deltaproteobacteria bacterium]
MSDLAPWVIGTAAGAYSLHRLALWLEARGWLFYLNKRPSTSGSIGDLFLDANSRIDASARYKQEAKHLDEAREAERERDDLDKEKR